MTAKYVPTNLIAKDWRKLATFYKEVFGCTMGRSLWNRSLATGIVWSALWVGYPCPVLAQTTAPAASQPVSRPTKKTVKTTAVHTIVIAKPSSHPVEKPISRPVKQLVPVVMRALPHPVGKATSRPVGKPTSRPTVKRSQKPSTQPSSRSRPVGKPSSRPTAKQPSHPVGKPSSRPTTKRPQKPSTLPSSRSRPLGKPVVPRLAPVKIPQPTRKLVVPRLTPVKIPQPTKPFRTGWLSFALTGDEQIWLDGREMGVGTLAYLRVLAGRHHLRLKHAKYGEVVRYVDVWPGRHVSVLRRGSRIGFRRFRWERSNALVRIYSSKGKPTERVVAPGSFCLPSGVCHVLMPGDHLYIQPDGRSIIVSPQGAIRSAQSYRPKPGHGFLTFYSYPPGALYLNKRMFAMTPVARLPLKPGKYKAWVRNGYLNMEWRGWIVIKEGEEVRKIAMTTPPKGANLVIVSKKPARIYVNGKFRGWTPAHVLPVSPGTYKVELQRIHGKRRKQTVEVMPGQLEIIRWK